VISVLVLGINVLSVYWYQHHVEFHYTLIAVPALTIGAVHGIAALGQRWRTITILAVAVTSICGSVLWGPLPWSRREVMYWPPSHPSAVAAREIIDDIPAGAAVSVHYRLAPHVSHRRLVYQFPNPFRVLLYGPDPSEEGTRLEARAEAVEYIALSASRTSAEERDWNEIASAFTPVERNQYWELYRRNGPLPPAAPR
jgi:hypothetical protein